MRHRVIFGAAIALWLGTASPTLADPIMPDHKVAREAARRGDHHTAAAHWQKLADFGMADAQMELGLLYAEGKGVTKDEQKAYTLLHHSAESGHARAYYHLGHLYERNPGFVPASETHVNAAIAPLPLPDRKEGYRIAADYYRQALDKGEWRAAYNLGKMYEKGRGVPEDKTQALTYYYVAQDTGTDKAQSLSAAMESTLDPADVTRARSNANTILRTHTAPARKNSDDMRFFGIVKTMATFEDNHDLGTQDDTPDTGLTIDARLGASYTPSGADMRFHGELRLVKSTHVIDTDDDDSGKDPMSDGFIEMRQLWAEFYNLAGDPRLSTKLGRQRFRDDRGLWWNDDLESVRMSMKSSLYSGFIAAGQALDHYRIGDNDDFREDEKDRLRLFGEVTHRITQDHNIDARFMAMHDYSGTPRIGTTLAADDMDRGDADLLWLGLRGHGAVPAGNLRVGYHLDGMMVVGTETMADTAAMPGGARRMVTGTRERDVAGWAMDGRINVALSDAPRTPTINAGYAFASGDDNPGGTGNDGAFRQTDMHSNSSAMNDDTRMGRVRHYGEVLRPELSNIHILSLGAQVPVMENGAVALQYFNYWLAEERSGLRSAGIDAPLNGRDAHLGQAMDMILYVPIADDLRRHGVWAESIASRFVIGGFMAGSAYGAAEDDMAWRGTAELRVRF